MEPAKIDWKRVESIFIKDKLYENINAPKWVDLPAPNDSFDDDSWFCRPDCNHPKTAEDFLRTTPTSKKKKPADGILGKDEAFRTVSVRNLIGGRDLLSQITEFCNELKKLTTSVRERGDDNDKLKEEEDQVLEGKDEGVASGGPRKVLREIDVKESEKPVLMEACIAKSEGIEKDGVKEKKSRKKRLDDAENIPIPLNLVNVKCVEEEWSPRIRTNPPSPQCFSSTRAPTKSTNAKETKSRFMERGILQEVKQNKKEVPTEEIEDKSRSFSIVEEKNSS